MIVEFVAIRAGKIATPDWDEMREDGPERRLQRIDEELRLPETSASPSHMPSEWHRFPPPDARDVRHPTSWRKTIRTHCLSARRSGTDTKVQWTNACPESILVGAPTEVESVPQEFDVVCLGGGVAGEALAQGLKDSGLSLAVVERELVGGECPYWGCVPSKTLLRSSETLTEADRARVLAASRVDWTVDFPKISTRVLRMARNLDDRRPAAAMEATGARLIRGEGTLTDLRTVGVGGEQLVARRAIVIANGSTAAIPPIPGLDRVDYWTNRQAAIPRELPGSLAILGGGAIGIELGQAFARLGCRVTVIEAAPMFLSLEEPEAGAALRPHLEADGIMLLIGDPCVAVEQPMMGPSQENSPVVVHLKSGATVRADRLLVATGRRPNQEAWRGVGLAQTERGWLKVDPATLEARAGVFGAGDVTGLGGFTHLAYYHAQIIARRLRGMDARADHTAVPRVTFTDPEVASVGLSEAAARATGIDVLVASADPAETARGYIHDFHRGALKLVADRERGVLIGATLVTPRAGEILGELVLAIKQGTPLKTLADVIHPFPAFNRVLGESLEQLAAKVTVPAAAQA
jgi:pyruvate/2-oxoglutarate dehydrogenase complex dihydrolipoamide dehydrogenase (E3) component